MQALRAGMIERDEAVLSRYCNVCLQLEARGLRSKRQQLTPAGFHREHDLHVGHRYDAIPVQQLDVKLFGSLCNLKCYMCFPEISSSVAAERKKLGLYAGPTHVKGYDLVRDKPKFYRDLHALAPNLRVLKFTGGEPWMNEDHFELVEFFIAHGYAQDITLKYITNGTHAPPAKLRHAVDHYRAVECLVSLDGVGDRDEYIRYGTEFDRFVVNLREIQGLVSGLGSSVTISILNVGYLDEIDRFLTGFGIDEEFQTFLSEPPHLTAASLPTEIKALYARRLAGKPKMVAATEWLAGTALLQECHATHARLLERHLFDLSR